MQTCAVPQFGHAQAVRVCDACHSHLSTQRKRCISRLVPYFERDNIPDMTKLAALDETYEMLTSGVEILEESKMVGIYGPLMHVVESSGDEKPNLRAKALSIISLLTDLDTTNCAGLAAVPGAIEKLANVVVKGNPQARLLAAEIVNALSRNKETIESIVMVDYVKHVIGLLNGQAADAKLLEVCAETLAALATESAAARAQMANNQAAVPNLLTALGSPSTGLSCQRVLVSVLAQLPSSSLVQHRAGLILMPLLKTLGAPTIMPLLEGMVGSEDGPLGLLEAGLLRQLVPEEADPLVAVLILIEKGKNVKIAHAILPILSEKADAGKKLCDSGQLGRLTSILHNHFDENMSLIVLRVLSSLASNESAVRQIVDSGGLYDLVNHMAGASSSLQTAYLSVLQSMLRHKYCLQKATDAGAIQALVPLCFPPTLALIRQMSLACLEIMCANESEVRVLVVGVATPASVVSFFLKEAEGLRLVRRLLEDPVTNSDLMEAGIFAALLRVLTGEGFELRPLAANALALCIQQNTTVDAGYITAISELMKSNGPEVGAELLAAFSAQPVYRQFIVQHGLVTALIGLLLSGQIESQKHAVLALANLAYEDAGSFAILRQGGVSVLVGLINHPVDQVQGCSLLALGNLCRTHECRLAVVRDGGADLIMEKFAGGAMSPVVENYCLWALRMLVTEAGVPEALSRMSCLRLVFPRLASHVSQKSDSRVHALALLSVMCGVTAFCEALSMFPGKQDLLVAMVIEPGPGRTWALHELSSTPITVLLQAPGYGEAVASLLSSSIAEEQRAGLGLCEQALALRPEENLRFVPFALVVRLLPLSTRVSDQVHL